MSGAALAWTAITNSFRSMSRTVLTVVAIFIGAFTLTLTTGVGNGINSYIDDTTSSIGGNGTLTVTKQSEDNGDEPRRYTGAVLQSNDTQDPDAGTVEALTPADLTKIRDEDGVVAAEPVLSVRPDYIVYDGSQKYQLSTAGYVAGTQLPLIAGEQPDPDSKTRQIALPVSYLDPLDFSDAEDAIDETVTIGVTDADDHASTVTAKVVAVVESTLATGDVASINDALVTALYDRQSVGLTTTEKQRYASVAVEIDSASTAAEITTLKDTLSDDGYQAESVEDQIGDFKTVIDAIVLVLNGFAIISLLAAGFGIVNTLLMSVKERTREIGLMKAMGLGGGSIFTMFSMEAVFIGFLGSVIGAGAAVVVGTIVNNALTGSVLADLPGLSLIAFAPATVIGIIALVMGIAFLAGSIPALSAARQDPIESLRYE
jgi:putative ABC transport system permease protein